MERRSWGLRAATTDAVCKIIAGEDPTEHIDVAYVAEQFPDPANFFPVPRKAFPVNLLRELRKKSCSAAVSSHEIGSGSLKIAKFPVKFPVSREFAWRRVRSPLRRQPGILAFGPASQETREWAGNPGFSRIRFRLWPPASPNLRRKLRKVFGLLREYSRFWETMGGDYFDHDCRPTSAVGFGH